MAKSIQELGALVQKFEDELVDIPEDVKRGLLSSAAKQLEDQGSGCLNDALREMLSSGDNLTIYFQEKDITILAVDYLFLVRYFVNRLRKAGLENMAASLAGKYKDKSYLIAEDAESIDQTQRYSLNNPTNPIQMPTGSFPIDKLIYYIIEESKRYNRFVGMPFHLLGKMAGIEYGDLVSEGNEFRSIVLDMKIQERYGCMPLRLSDVMMLGIVIPFIFLSEEYIKNTFMKIPHVM